MAEWAPKRFWKTATVAPAGEGFEVLLDGRKVKTPAKAPLILPTEAMAQAIAAEWDAQEKTVDPRTMPVTRAANAALDKVMHQFDEVAELIAAYGDSDLLCYRAAHPAGLAARQAEAWDPLLGWSAQALEAPLTPRAGVIHAPQPAESLARLAAKVHALTPFELTALHDLVSLSGSLVIGLAVAEGQATAAELWEVSRIDESWQAEEWGADEEAESVAALKKEAFLAAERFLHLSRG